MIEARENVQNMIRLRGQGQQTDFEQILKEENNANRKDNEIYTRMKEPVNENKIDELTKKMEKMALLLENQQQGGNKNNNYQRRNNNWQKNGQRVNYFNNDNGNQQGNWQHLNYLNVSSEGEYTLSGNPSYDDYGIEEREMYPMETRARSNNRMNPITSNIQSESRKEDN